MTAAVSLLIGLFATAEPKIEWRLDQVGPARDIYARTDGQTRAVILLHGFIFHFKDASVKKPGSRDWQKPNSLLVKTLEKDSDVFSFGYGQNASLSDIIKHGGIKESIEAVKKLGYKEIVLVGHSAGGLIAREYVEDHPDCGVTKVMQICSPNAGTPKADIEVNGSQQAFLDSLTEAARKKCLESRAKILFPEKIEFLCILGHLEGANDTDGTVPCACQWPEDLRKQGVPVYPIALGHNKVTRTQQGADLIAKLVRDKQPRWKPEQVEATVKQFFMK